MVEYARFERFSVSPGDVCYRFTPHTRFFKLQYFKEHLYRAHEGIRNPNPNILIISALPFSVHGQFFLYSELNSNQQPSATQADASTCWATRAC